MFNFILFIFLSIFPFSICFSSEKLSTVGKIDLKNSFVSVLFSMHIFSLNVIIFLLLKFGLVNSCKISLKQLISCEIINSSAKNNKSFWKNAVIREKCDLIVSSDSSNFEGMKNRSTARMKTL